MPLSHQEDVVSRFPGVLGRRLVRPALAATAALVLAGCSSGSSADAGAPSAGTGGAPATSSPAPASASGAETSSAAPTDGGGPTGASGTPAAGPDRCHTGDLTGSLSGGDPGAGQRGAALTLRNTGGRACDVEGFGGVGLLDAAGRPLPAQQVRQDTPAPALVTVPPGATVTSQLHWTVVPGDADPASGCPTPASLSVIPPDERDALTVAWSLGQVCDGGRLEQQAYVRG